MITSKPSSHGISIRSLACLALALVTALAPSGFGQSIPADLPKKITGQTPLHEVWDEEVPVMGHLAVAMDGSVLVFKERREKGLVEVKRSKDHGKTWTTEKIVIRPDRNGWQATTYCCDPGITLRRGKHKGRLLMPAQVFVGSINTGGGRTYLNKGQNRKYFAKRYSNALYSDDGGKTWTPSAPFPILGTSEPGLVELNDGSIYYNARTHVRPGNKIIGRSKDGGQSWNEAAEDDELFDGPPDVYGCKGALLRLPFDDRDILLFSGPGRRDQRHDITVRVSFDGGRSWPIKRVVKKGPGNYTWLAAGRQGTPSAGMIYLLSNKDWMARFNLAWLLESQDNKTSDK